MQHAGQFHIDAVEGAAINLGWRIDTLLRLADQLEVFGGFKRDIGGHRQLGGILCQSAIAEPLAAVNYVAALHGEFGRIDVPMRGGCLHKHHASLCAGFTQLFPAVAHTAAAASNLRAQQGIDVNRVNRCSHDANGIERHVQLFGQQLCERRVNALAHFRTID